MNNNNNISNNEFQTKKKEKCPFFHKPDGCKNGKCDKLHAFHRTLIHKLNID